MVSIDIFIPDNLGKILKAILQALVPSISIDVLINFSIWTHFKLLVNIGIKQNNVVLKDFYQLTSIILLTPCRLVNFCLVMEFGAKK
jgi:hypothetical protein